MFEKKGNRTNQFCIDFKKTYDSVRREYLYNILIEFGIPMKLVRLIYMCLTETCSRVRIRKDLSEIFPVRKSWKRGDALLPLLFNFSLEYAIRSVQVNQNGLKLNGTHRFLVFADDVNTLGGRVYTVKEHGEPLLVASKEIGLVENADKTKYMVMSRDQNAKRRMIIDNRFYEKAEQLKYLGKI